MFDELMPSLDELGPYKQLTSYDRGPMEFLPAFYRNWTRKCVMLMPGKPHVLADIEGAGIVNRLFVAWPKFLNKHSFREIVLRIYWDGSDVPSVNVPLGDFFGVHHCKYRQYHSRFFNIVSGGITCDIPMPFAQGCRIEVEQEGKYPTPFFFYGVGYYQQSPEQISPLRFHAQWHREALCERGKPFTFVECEGDGFYLGTHLSTQNRSLWWTDWLHRWFLPEGFGLGHLEGWEALYVDGEEKSSHEGTGTEEYFNTGWYFINGRFTTLDYGCLSKSYLSGRTASYRYHWLYPIPFKKSFHGVMDHGMDNAIAADYSAVAYWYQKGVNKRSHPLPAVNERRLKNPVLSRVIPHFY